MYKNVHESTKMDKQFKYIYLFALCALLYIILNETLTKTIYPTDFNPLAKQPYGNQNILNQYLKIPLYALNGLILAFGTLFAILSYEITQPKRSLYWFEEIIIKWILHKNTIPKKHNKNLYIQPNVQKCTNTHKRRHEKNG